MVVPKFETYYPSRDEMSQTQRDFYDFLVRSFEVGKFPPVEGNVSYLFAYSHRIIECWNTKGFEYVNQCLLYLAEKYYLESQFSEYCRGWANDCLLGLKQYDEFLNLTEPENPFSLPTHKSNERCNVNYFVGNPANPLDLVKMYGGNFTKYTKENSGAFRDFLIQVFQADSEANGPWLNRLLKAQSPLQSYRHSLFSGCPGPTPYVTFPFYCFYVSDEETDSINKLIRDAENLLRESANMPKVGEGWISETNLFYLVKKAFPQTPVIQHGRPDWLGRQHLDIWIPNWKIAIEYHGAQHFEPIDFFGGSDGYEATRRRDERKYNLCIDNGVELIVAKEGTETKQVIDRIQNIYQNRRAD